MISLQTISTMHTATNVTARGSLTGIGFCMGRSSQPTFMGLVLTVNTDCCSTGPTDFIYVLAIIY